MTLSLDEAMAPAAQREINLVALDDALDTLAKLDERQSRMVELRFFGGLSIEETSEVLGVSAPTVKREWASARAWLYREISGASPSAEQTEMTREQWQNVRKILERALETGSGGMRPVSGRSLRGRCRAAA